MACIMARKLTDTDLQNLPACVQEYIKLVIKKMRYRKKVRADVQAELTAHFEDELRDCKNDEEKEQKAQQLIADFGDVKLLGALLRRAKKRCRPLWRTIAARTSQAVGILILCFIPYAVWFFTGKPVITTNYVAELNRIVRPVADESLNAAPLYHQAAERYSKLPDDISKLLGKKYHDANDTERHLMQKWLNDNKETLDLVIAGAKKPYYWQKYEGEEMMSILMPMPYLAKFRQLAYSFRWRAYFHAEQGQYKEAFDDIISCYRLGQHIRKGDKPLVEQLVGTSIEALSVQALRSILSKYQMDSSTLAKLQKDFEQIVAGENFITNLKAEKLFMYDWIQRWFTEGGFGGGHLYLPEFKKMAQTAQIELGINKDKSWFNVFCSNLVAAASFLFGLSPSKDETLKSANEYYDFFERELALKTPVQIRAEKAKIDEKIKQITHNNQFLNILSPAIENVLKISSRLKTDVEATLTIIAILRYKQDKGQCPQSLDELLKAGYVKEIPIDSFSDKPLIYRKTEDGFILYSVGHNFTDDGGDRKGKITNWTDEGDAVLWPVQEN